MPELIDPDERCKEIMRFLRAYSPGQQFFQGFKRAHFSPLGGGTIFCMAVASILSAVRRARSLASAKSPAWSVALKRCAPARRALKSACSRKIRNRNTRGNSWCRGWNRSARFRTSVAPVAPRREYHATRSHLSPRVRGRIEGWIAITSQQDLWRSAVIDERLGESPR